ncbi:hypothetical protein C8R46DRAFT_1211712 [Mycena filopes]|nr:hypothetical protein C8R46DRAFT_1211712 [Mycena filopes]
MPSSHSHSHSHRRRANKDLDDEPLPPRAEESHADSYSRHSNDYRPTNTNYRRTQATPSHSGRSAYDMSRPSSSSSRSHRDSNWGLKDTESRYTEEYYRDERRQEYDVGVKTREPESWPARTVPEPRPVPEPRFPEEWAHRYDTSYPTPAYSEQPSWPASSSTAVNHRNGHQERGRWQSHGQGQDNRAHAYKGRQPDRAQPLEQPQQRTQPIDQRRDWNSQPVRGNAYVEPWNPPPEKKPILDNRSWEPAPSWQPSHGFADREHQNHRNQNGPRNDYHNKSSYTSSPSAGRRAAGSFDANNPRDATHRDHSHTNNKPQRDWRNDDGNPNKIILLSSLLSRPHEIPLGFSRIQATTAGLESRRCYWPTFA